VSEKRFSIVKILDFLQEVIKLILIKVSFLKVKGEKMETITYSQVQDLVSRVPATKLPLVHSFLVDLANNTDTPSPQLDFMRLPLSERRRILEQQARQMVAHYEQTAAEREIWQGGDFTDED
jgi:hypothetical protein